MRWWVGVLGLLLTVSANADAGFDLSGRISLRQDDTAYHGTLTWHHAATDDDLLLSGPFGQGAAELRRDAGGAVLQLPDGTRHEAATLDALADRLFGAPVPIAALPDWIRGIAPEAQMNADGRPLRLVLPGWTVEWLRYDAAGHPALMSLESPSVGVRLRIDSWIESPRQEVVP